MKTKLSFLILFLCNNTYSQNLEHSPTKSYYVNAAQSNKEERNTKLDSPFEVIVTTNKINLGDKFDLQITKRDFKNVDGWTIEELSVKDPSKEYKVCKVYIASKENNYTIYICSCDLDDNGNPTTKIELTNSNYIGWYEMWKRYRNGFN